jgi:hypothetical protein
MNILFFFSFHRMEFNNFPITFIKHLKSNPDEKSQPLVLLLYPQTLCNEEAVLYLTISGFNFTI